MSYLVVNENTWCNNDGEVVNEGLKTAAHNIWTRTFIGGGHAKNTKHDFGSAARILRTGIIGGVSAASGGVEFH